MALKARSHESFVIQVFGRQCSDILSLVLGFYDRCHGTYVKYRNEKLLSTSKMRLPRKKTIPTTLHKLSGLSPAKTFSGNKDHQANPNLPFVAAFLLGWVLKLFNKT